MTKYRFVEEHREETGRKCWYTEFYRIGSWRWHYMAGSASYNKDEAKKFFDNIVIGEPGKKVLSEK